MIRELVALLALQVTPAPADTLLATIPDWMTIASTLMWPNHRAGFRTCSTIAFAADGAKVAYAGRRGDRMYPVIGDAIGSAYDYVSPPILAGGHVFFTVTRRVSESAERTSVWIDGHATATDDWIGELGVSADGSRIAFWTQPGARVGNAKPATSSKHFLTVGSSASGTWSFARGAQWVSCPLSAPLLSHDGKRVVTWALDAKGALILERAGKEKALCEPGRPIDSIAISPDGGAVAWIRATPSGGDASPLLERDDTPELWFGKRRIGKDRPVVAIPAVDPTGVHVACAITTARGVTLAIDEEDDPPGGFAYVLEIAFDPTGRRVAFVANRGGKPSTATPGEIEGGECILVTRNVTGAPDLIEAQAFHAIADLTWDATGERVAYRAQAGSGWKIVCGAVESEPHDDVGAPHFDGDTIGYGSRDRRELWWRRLALTPP